ncbi:MAG: hypothetical protein JWN02_2231 [Acidobacteria bacterium]|nr:hypothetical protein [Acidobacteriota bacterium]
MPVTPSYPGIYIEELPSTSHTIAAAPTSIAVFVGYTHPFKTNTFKKAVELFSFTDYEREFGGFYRGALLDENVPNAVNQFFLNGGAQAYVVGLKPASYFGAVGVAIALSAGTVTLNDQITFAAREPTDPTAIHVSVDNVDSLGSVADVTVSYGSRAPEVYRSVSIANPDFIETRMSNATILKASVGAGATFSANTIPPFTPATITAPVTVNHVTFAALNATNPAQITVTITNVKAGNLVADVSVTDGASTETFANVSLLPTLTTSTGPDFILNRMQGSAYVKPSLGPNPKFTKVTGTINAATPSGAVSTFNANDFNAVFHADSDLDKLPIFNILVLPGVTDSSVLSIALAFAERKRAFMILDPPVNSVADQTADATHTTVFDYMDKAPRSPNGALYFPYVKTSDPVTGLAVVSGTTTPFSLPPSGYVAGIYARTDNNRGVWKAPAGLETTLLNTTGVVDNGRMNDLRQGVLNLAGINCLRTFPGIGTVTFGARTLVSTNPAYEQWKYVPVRRTALFIEQTLYRNLGWAVFEPNDEPLWLALRTSVENFMLSLFSRGAFQGSKPSEAFLVRCDSSTTTQTDINLGVVNIIVAFAPLKPAEFVIVKIAQLAGQAQ